MKNDDSNQSVYDRREFLKKAGLTGLALAGLGSFGGCALLPNVSMPVKVFGRDYELYDFNAVAQRYEKNPMAIKSIDDFALSGEELGWMRLAEFVEKGFGIFLPNPHKGNSQKYCFEQSPENPKCEEWLLAEYTGRTNFPYYQLILRANRFASETDCLKIGEKIKKDGRSTKRNFKMKIFSKDAFMVGITNLWPPGDYEQEQEHIARMNLYQKKRGLDLVWTNF